MQRIFPRTLPPACLAISLGLVSLCVQAQTRNPLQQPFAVDSIWNMPIGSNAVYVPVNLPTDPGGYIWAGMPGVDDEIIVLTPTAPLTPVLYSSAGWTGADRCAATTQRVITNVPIPTEYIVPNNGQNNSATFLMADNRTLVSVQPLARCTAGGSATSITQFQAVDIYGPGIQGAHGGSGLSAIGGSIRIGELRPNGPAPQHVLKVNVYGKGVYFPCTVKSDCFRWPADRADGYAVGWYGTANPLPANPSMKPGSLLAIPVATDITTLGLETAPAKMLAWTLQNYGAYVVDDTYGRAFAINVENGTNGSFRTQFKSDWGFKLEQFVGDKTPWVRDMQRLVQALHIVDNNGPMSIGGGGVPLQPLALPLQ